jgi:hypothetical protein
MPKVTLSVNQKRLKVKEDRSRGSRRENGSTIKRSGSKSTDSFRRSSRNANTLKTVRYRIKDILYVGRSADPDLRSAVACVVYDGYDAATSSWLHLYVYLLVDDAVSGKSETETAAAAKFVGQMSRFIETVEHRARLRSLGTQLAACGQLQLVSSEEAAPGIDSINSASTPGPNSPRLSVYQQPNGNAANMPSIPENEVEDVVSVPATGSMMPSSPLSDVSSPSVFSISYSDGNDGWPSGYRLSDSIDLSESVNSGYKVAMRQHQSAPTTTDELPTLPMPTDSQDCSAVLKLRMARLSLLLPPDEPASAPLAPSFTGKRSSPSSPVNVGSIYIPPPPVANLTDELRTRLSSGTPILLPPKDYDTVNRNRGNLVGAATRRCLNEDIVGFSSATGTSVF